MVATRADELVTAFRTLTRALDIDPDASDLVHELANACGWGTRPTTAPLLPSGISHGVPWGLSIVPGTRELRVFVEAQADPASPEAYWRTAAAVTALAARDGADLARLHSVTGSFAPSSGARLWHAVAIAPDGPRRWHAYACTPQLHDPEAALRRAGVDVAVSLREGDRISIVSLDLVAHGRVKAYVLLPDAALADVARLIDDPRMQRDAVHFARTMLGDERRIWWLVALGYIAGTPRQISAALHFGVRRHVAEVTARSRIARLLDELELDVHAWQRASTAFAAHHFVSLQHRDGQRRVTVYFEPEVQR